MNSIGPNPAYEGMILGLSASEPQILDGFATLAFDGDWVDLDKCG
jgi:hypothetical protein